MRCLRTIKTIQTNFLKNVKFSLKRTLEVSKDTQIMKIFGKLYIKKKLYEFRICISNESLKYL